MAKKCTNIQKSLEWCEGTPVYPGIKKDLYYISKSDIVKWPTLKKDVSGPSASPVYEGNFELAESKKWLKISIDVRASGLTSEAQGEPPSQTQLNKLTAVHPGVGQDASAASFYLNNNDSVFLVSGMDGLYRVVGCDLYPGKTTVAQDLGQGPTGTASTTISVEATDLCPAPFYAGKIDTEDGAVNGDGSPVEDF